MSPGYGAIQIYYYYYYYAYRDCDQLRLDLPEHLGIYSSSEDSKLIPDGLGLQ